MLEFELVEDYEPILALNVRFARNRAQLLTGGEALQLALSPKQALQLGQELKQAAERIASMRPKGPTN